MLSSEDTATIKQQLEELQPSVRWPFVHGVAGIDSSSVHILTYRLICASRT